MNNDNKILELQKQISSKKEDIGKIKMFSPITNCLITLNNTDYNIQALKVNELQLLLIQLNSYLNSAISLNITDVIISGFVLQDWIQDIKSKLNIIAQKEEQKKLKLLENKLKQMLSSDKKIELELNDIENMLK